MRHRVTMLRIFPPLHTPPYTPPTLWMYSTCGARPSKSSYSEVIFRNVKKKWKCLQSNSSSRKNIFTCLTPTSTTLRWNFYEQHSIMKSQHLSLKRLCFPMFSLRLGVIAHRFFSPLSHIPHTGLDIWAEIKGQNCLEQKKERSEKILNLKGIKVSISILARLNASSFTSFTSYNTHFAIKGFVFCENCEHNLSPFNLE